MIKTLDGISHIQHRPELYIGPTTFATHLMREVIANAEDECLADRCKKINVFILNDINDNQWCVVQDYGGGVPLISEALPDKDIPVEICCSINTGGKFDNGSSNSGYKISAGRHVEGLKAVNALSSYLYLTTKANDEDNNYWEYSFKEGKFISKRLIKIDSNNQFSTEIKFLPNPKYFQHPTIESDIILNELEMAQYGLGNSITITYNGNKVENKYYENFIGNNYIEVVSDSINNDNGESCNLTISLYNDFDSGKIFNGIVNLLPSNEGTHMNVCNNLLKNKLIEIANKNKKLIQPNDILVSIKILCNLKLLDPKFDSQTKVKLSMKVDELQNLIEPVINKLIKNNRDFFNKVIDKAEEYRVNLEASKKSRKSKSSSKTVKVEGLKDCICRKAEKCTLYLVEGTSASGNMTQCRNPEYDAILGLRGKILNVIADKATKFKILENQVINNIANALGYKLYGEIDSDKCRYGKIMITVGGDFDGYQIACLLINIFYTFFPELIRAGMVYIISCPLYGTTINKKFIPIFTKEETEKYKDYVVERYKGLSEMDPEQLYEAAINPLTRRCLQLTFDNFDIKDLWDTKLGNLKTEVYIGE